MNKFLHELIFAGVNFCGNTFLREFIFPNTKELHFAGINFWRSKKIRHLTGINIQISKSQQFCERNNSNFFLNERLNLIRLLALLDVLIIAMVAELYWFLRIQI